MDYANIMLQASGSVSRRQRTEDSNFSEGFAFGQSFTFSPSVSIARAWITARFPLSNPRFSFFRAATKPCAGLLSAFRHRLVATESPLAVSLLPPFDGEPLHVVRSQTFFCPLPSEMPPLVPSGHGIHYLSFYSRGKERNPIRIPDPGFFSTRKTLPIA
jgi:hypothetical protein